jgi:hypothetical protein
MTANKFNIGDEVRYIGEDHINGLRKGKRYIIHSLYTNDYVFVISAQNLLKVPSERFEPWSDKLHCHYCGAEIVIREVTKVTPSYWRDIAEHCMSCPAGSTRVVFSTEQEALDAYSMKWEG